MSAELDKVAVPDLTSEQQLAVTERYLTSLGEMWPIELFPHAGRLTVLTTVELGMIKATPDSLHIILTERPPDDIWAGQWHVPGSVLRPTDAVKDEHDYDDALGRAYREVGGVRMSRPIEYETVRRKAARGSEATVRFIAEVIGDPDKGRYFDVEDLLRDKPPVPLVETHQKAIADMAYVAAKQRFAIVQM